MMTGLPWTTEGHYNIDKLNLFYLHITEIYWRWADFFHSNSGFMLLTILCLPWLFAWQPSLVAELALSSHRTLIQYSPLLDSSPCHLSPFPSTSSRKLFLILPLGQVPLLHSPSSRFFLSTTHVFAKESMEEIMLKSCKLLPGKRTELYLIHTLSCPWDLAQCWHRGLAAWMEWMKERRKWAKYWSGFWATWA